ncbi:hypothetical protein PR048_007560 [Dryococelus australis]|uniref:PHD-type domain-containing protein n=1 Tax=Dryococelus australis TaxID=614101 RepID=A0ABQ9HUJ9_9NEOP|nr:hypothetical protein PR048_007560 [Dryococelus australis]
MWSVGATRSDDPVMDTVGEAVLQSSSRRCSYCGRFGASITCTVGTCQRCLHLPCAAASGAFQDCKTMTLVCMQHLDQVPLLSEYTLPTSVHPVWSACNTSTWCDYKDYKVLQPLLS